MFFCVIYDAVVVSLLVNLVNFVRVLKGGLFGFFWSIPVWCNGLGVATELILLIVSA